MSLIYTAELCGANPFEYLVALQRHAKGVAECPGEWMPWNYQEACSRLEFEGATTPPA
jgi:transposase